MGSTNKTTNYELSQFLGTDKPAWLQDYNGDMQKIDTGIHNAKTAADNAQNAADAAQEDATSALSGISDINTELGGVENSLSSAIGSINTINSLIGNGTPTTTDQTIIGAINEINAKLPEDISDKHFLFVGDSYGDSTGRGFNCWPEFMAEALGLSSAQFNNLCKDNSGIYGSDNPQYMFITQLQEYAGDKTKVTDIVIGEASNDTFSDDPTDSRYPEVKSNLSDIVNYVKANYPNATLYIGYIANSYDTSSIVGARVYKARQTFKKLLFDWCAELNIPILNGVEYALAGGGQFFTSDLLHPSVVGEKYLGYAMARAYTSGNANVSYFYKNAYSYVTGFTAKSEDRTKDVVIQNNLISVILEGLSFDVAQDTVFGFTQPILTSPDIFFNQKITVYGFIRFGNFDNIAERVVPCAFIFDGDKVFAHPIEVENSQWTTSWTAGANAFITIDGIVLTTNSDVTA